ncbi:MAG: sulfotransferase [Rhizomicrobium sp.]
MNAHVNLCACGSGLRSLRCCGLNLATVATGEASRHLLPLVDRAIASHAKGELAEAAKICLDVLELAPGQGGALAILYQVRKVAGPASAAEALIRRMVALDPNNVWATQELALMLFGKGNFSEAEIHARNAVRIAPADIQSHNLMGMIMTEAGRPQVGEFHYRRALELLGEPPPVLLANLAWNLKNQGRMAQSRALYRQSVERDPAILQTLLGWARMEETDRNFVRAEELLDRAEKLSPNNASVLLQRAIVRGRMKDYGEALKLLDRIAGESGSLGPNEMLEKGRLLDKMGRHDEAFRAFAEGKRGAMRLSGNAYQADHARDLADRLKRYFTTGRLKIVPRGHLAPGPQPLFIVGFPRSGTTMVEQTLSAHPGIAAGDELAMINDITGLMPRMLGSPLAYPEALADLWMGDMHEGLDNLRDYYLQRARQLGIVEAKGQWFTDKMPLNETHLGLIGLMFPESPIVHVLRHPLDVVISVFANHLTHGFHCANALETIARHYLLVADLVEHYRSQMTLRYLPIRYEDIVEDQETHVRRMLGFVGVSFDKRCLRFHENTRYARTASYAQVTEKLYRSSRYRYRHYLKHLEPVIPLLAPAIERLGYSIDG